MEKLTSILAIAEGVVSGTKVLEKTLVLARGVGARIELLVVDPDDIKHFASLCSTCGYDEVVLCSEFADGGSLTDIVLRRISETSPDLVTKARAKGHSFAGFERNDQALVASCPVPLILMGEQAWRRPLRIAAAVDMSGEQAALARGIVHTSGFLSLGLDGELEVIYSEPELQDEEIRMARAVKLSRVVREFHVGSERMRRIDGAPAKTLPPIAASGEYDILVLGALTHHTGLSAIHATLTNKLIAAFSGDVVLIKEDARSIGHIRQECVKSQAAL